MILRPILCTAPASLALMLVLVACTASPEPAVPAPPPLTAGEAASGANTPPQASHPQRLQAIAASMAAGHHQQAASELRALLAIDSLSLPVRRQALATQALLYLQTDTPQHDLKAAGFAVDELYRLSQQHPRQEGAWLADGLLLEAVSLALENALRLNKLESTYRASLEQQEQLQQKVHALEQALEKLRQLSLQ